MNYENAKRALMLTKKAESVLNGATKLFESGKVSLKQTAKTIALANSLLDMAELVLEQC